MVTARKTTIKKTPGPMQIDPGWFLLYQNGGQECGQVYVVPQTGGTIEYWYLYALNIPTGKTAWIYPGPNEPAVSTTTLYQGEVPGDFNPVKYRDTLLPLKVSYIVGNCIVSPPMAARRAAKKGKPKKRG